MPRTVFMGNLPAWVTADEIESWLTNENILFDEVKVIRDFETQESKGYAFVEAASDEDLKALITRFNRAPLDDKVLRVNEARANEGQKGPRPAKTLTSAAKDQLPNVARAFLTRRAGTCGGVNARQPGRYPACVPL